LLIAKINWLVRMSLLQAIKNPAFLAGFWASIALVIEYGIVASSVFSYTPVYILLFPRFLVLAHPFLLRPNDPCVLVEAMSLIHVAYYGQEA